MNSSKQSENYWYNEEKLIRHDDLVIGVAPVGRKIHDESVSHYRKPNGTVLIVQSPGFFPKLGGSVKLMHHPSIKKRFHFALLNVLGLILATTASCGSIDWHIDHEEGASHAYTQRWSDDLAQQIRRDLHGKGIQSGTGVAVRSGHRLSLGVSIWYSSNHELVYSGPIEFTYKHNPQRDYGAHVKDYGAFSVFPYGIYGMRVGGHREFSINHTCSPGHVIKQARCLLFTAEMAGRDVEVRNDDGLNLIVIFKDSCTPVSYSFLHFLGNPAFHKDLGCFRDSLRGPKQMSAWFDQDDNIKHGSLIRPLFELARLWIMRPFD